MAAAAVAGTGCSDPAREFVCQGSSECVRGGAQGECVFPQARCAFPDSGCGSGLRWDDTAGELAGECTDGSGADGGAMPDAGEFPNQCGGTSPLPGVPGEPCGVCDSGMWKCSGSEALLCDGELSFSVPIAFEGTVSASTEFSGSYRAELAVDADFTSSWFSSGPEGGGAPTLYRWSGTQRDCLQSLSIVGNGQHDNEDFRTDFGFGQVTVQVYDGATLVFSDTAALPGTPDPDAAMTPRVMGDRIDLLFLGHESPDCGGFSELLVNALR